MDEAKALLTAFRASGFSLAAEDHRLIVSPASKLTDVDREAIRVHRDDLLAWLEAERVDRLGDDEFYALVEADLIAFGTFCATRRYARGGG